MPRLGNQWEDGNTRWQEQVRVNPHRSPEYDELRREIERLLNIVDLLERLEAERGSTTADD